MKERSRSPGGDQATRVVGGLLPLLLISLGCTPEVGETGRRVDPIPSLAGSPVGHSVEWGELRYFDVASDGRVAALDRYNSEVVILSTDGSIETRFGQSGQGPGEIQTGGPLALVADKIIMADQHRVSSWSDSGDFLIAQTTGWVSQLWQMSDSTLLAIRPVTGRDEDGADAVVFSVDGLAESPALAGSNARDIICGGCQAVPTADGALAVAPTDPDSGPILLTDLGPSVISYDVDRVYWTDEEWADYVVNSMRSAGFAATDPKLAAVFSAAAARPRSAPDRPKRLVRHEDGMGYGVGHFWILAQVEAGELSVVDAFTLAGEYVGRVPLDQKGFDRISIEGHWLVALRLDEVGRPRLWKYDLRDALDGLVLPSGGDAL